MHQHIQYNTRKISLLFFAWLVPLLYLAASLPVEKAQHFPCALAFPQSAINEVNTIYIPFTLIGRLMIVQASVDNVRGNFIVDTGSERLLLNKDYIRPEVPGKMVTAIGNTGPLPAEEYQTDSLRLERLKIDNLLAHLVNLDHIEVKKNTRITGILGYNVFREFELLIDFPNSRIVLSRVDKNGVRLDPVKPWERPYDSLSFELKKHFIVVKSVVNNVQLNMILDSGAELNLIDRRVNKKIFEKFTVIKRVNLIGAGKKQIEVLAGVLWDVQCGNQITEQMNTLLTSMDEINSTFGISVEGVLGYEFLGKRRTMINYKKRKLYFFGASRS